MTPDGRLAHTADNGNSGRKDRPTPVSVIDLEAKSPRVVDKVVGGGRPRRPGDQPEQQARGRVAAARQQCGQGRLLLWPQRQRRRDEDRRQDGDEDAVEVRGLPEGVVFSQDGRDLYVGNFIDQDISILRVDGDPIVDTGKSFALPGHPASMRGRTQ